MKRHILISLLVVLSITCLSGAFELPGPGINLEDRLAAYKQGELIVRFADPAPGSQLASGPVLVGPLSRRSIRNVISNHIIPGAVVDRDYDKFSPGLAVIKLPGNAKVIDAFIKFNLSANIRYAEPNYKYKLLDLPNANGFKQLWGTDNTIQTGANTQTTQSGDSNIIVAVADTGIDYSHPELVQNIWVNQAELNGADNVDDDGNGYIDDIYGYDFAGAIASDPEDDDSDPKDTFFHGTHISGIINIIGNNQKDTLGDNYNIKMMALKIFADDYSLEPEVFAGDAVEAIGYAVENGAKIINASWGGQFYSQSLYDAIKDAGDAGLLFVAAAGNDYGNNNDTSPVYPACFDLDNIISVTSKDSDNQLSVFSNYGASTVDLAEPGMDILSTTPTYETFAMLVYGVSKNYEILSGTSMAAPHASAACAILWSQYSSLPGQSIKTLLLKTADPIETSSRLSQSNGSINLNTALLAIPSGTPGKILNTRYDPNDTDKLYDSIQDAIDDANNGDELIIEADHVYTEAIDFKGKAITLRSGDITNPAIPDISPDNTFILGSTNPGTPVVTFMTNEGPGTILKGLTIGWGSAEYGSGISCQGASPTITDCIITNNFSTRRGGGIDCYNASPTITNCQITENFAEDVGGGIACYNSNPTISNCLIANNSAIYQGGGIALDLSSPVITNCTVIIDKPGAPQDGGIFAFNDSNPSITNCILRGNGDDLFNCTATYSAIEDNDSGGGNIHTDPMFTDGPLGKYYLTQISAGQLVDSPCVNTGNPLAGSSLQTDSLTTRTDGILDEAIIDMGYHYPSVPTQYVQLNIFEVINNVPIGPDQSRGHVEPDPNNSPYQIRKYEVLRLIAIPDQGYRIKSWVGTDDNSSREPNNSVTLMADTIVAVGFEPIPKYRLRTEVIGGHGSITPYHRNDELYYEGEVVRLIVTPQQNYIVDKWQGTDDDTSWSLTNTVTIDSDKEITVSFRRPATLHVPAQYHDIASALNDAYPHGDKIIVSAGVYSGAFDFQGKAIVIASENPDDPCSVAATVLQSSGAPVFIFQSGEGNDSIVDGFTIQGQGDPGYMTLINGEGLDGANAFGGAISCLNGSSPTLSNLIIRDCVARGQDGENNAVIYDPPDPAPDPLEPLEPLEPLPDPPEPVDPGDANVPVEGIPGEPGEPGLPGEPGADGAEGAAGLPGGKGGDAYGGAMHFDANSTPVILNCTIINCSAVGGDGGFGQAGQGGQDGQGGQPGQDGQDGQAASEPLNDGAPAAGGSGGMGGDGGPGGFGGIGGNGGKGGDGGEALGGAIFFGPNCTPTIRSLKIMNCITRQGLGNYGGDGGAGGTGGAGAAPGAGGGGGTGEPDGEDGGDGAESAGGNGGDGGIGGDMGVNGLRSWAGAIFFSENCRVDMSDTIISGNKATTIVPTYAYGGGDGGVGGDGGEGEGDAAGGNGGIGGDGGAGGTSTEVPEDEEPAEDEPNAPNDGPGDGGAGGAGVGGGANGDAGANGLSIASFTPSYGGANYYDIGCKVELTDCIISYNNSRPLDFTGYDGGGENYESGCDVILNRCEYIGNKAGLNGYGGAQYFSPSCVVQANDCNYVNNSTGLDGGGLSWLSECTIEINESSFIGNSTSWVYGSGGAIYAGGIVDMETGGWYNGSRLAINDTVFGNNEATFGGALYWHGEGADISISKAVISNNTAEHGGGMYFSGGAPTISGCNIMGNKAKVRVLPDEITYYYGYYEWPYGGGGGIFCWSSDAIIEDSFITNNSSVGSGGGVYFGGQASTPTLNNCLVKANTAIFNGGGIISSWLSSPTISSSTIVENTAFDANDTEHGRGGGLACAYGSQTTLINSILWDNTASNGNQISIGADQEPFYLAENPTTLTVSYSDIKGGRYANSFYIEPGRVLNWGAGNININPLFAGNYYLSHIAAGQNADSPCVDAGSDLAVNLNLNNSTTRMDAVPDADLADIGFHYPIGEDQHHLTVKIIGEHGTVMPTGGIYNKNTVVTLTARSEMGYQVSWKGTDDDSSHSLTNTVTMDRDRTVIVEFTEYTGKTVTVPSRYPTIRDALLSVKNGDTIVIEPGTYHAGYESTDLIINKSITITSRNPDDPNVVASTIIDGDDNNIGIRLTAGTTARTVLNGLTIQNCGGTLGDGPDGDRDAGHPDGYDGTCGEGAAIYIENGASPTIKNCVIINNLLQAGNGGTGEGETDTENAGRGGWSGWAHGGAIYCGPGSNPKFINCIIENNAAHGGDGGDSGGASNYGGNWSRSQTTYYDPNSLLTEEVFDELWKIWTWDNAGTYGPIYDIPLLSSFLGDPRMYSGHGGGAYCDIGSVVSFINCEIRGNRTSGGMSGTGLEPQVAYEIQSYGAGVYCAADSIVNFQECIFENNIASGLSEGVDPNNRLDPYIGYGGGVCAERSASVVFNDCNFIDNEADSGGGIYINDTEVIIADCNLTSNTALRGGGLYNISGLVNMFNSNVTNNRATYGPNAPADQNPIAQGAGLFCTLGGINIQDCNIAGNIADVSGGGAYLRDVGNASFINNLITNNGSGRDGGGVSVNWYTSAYFSNCTFAGNTAIGNVGQTNKTGYGGGLYCSYLGDCTVIDSIFWNNSGLNGSGIAVGTGFEFDKRPGTLTVYNSDIKNGRSAIWIDNGSVLNWGEGNINQDPLFVTGPYGRHYLSQTSAGQSQNSPCVDVGSNLAGNLGLRGYTTRTDQVVDVGIVDMGYHYLTREPCSLYDLAFDGIVDFQDYAILARNWLANNCSEANNWCQGADVTSDTHVDMLDIAFLVDCWLAQDTIPPNPDPSQWETAPYIGSLSSITMVAKTAVDFWGWDVEYYFECTGNDGCHDSGWQKSPTYTDSGLTADAEYGYRVKTRDGAGNETGWSEIRYAGEDNTPPTPAPYMETITADSETAITMTSTIAYDISGVEYYFESFTDGNDSGWQNDPNYTVDGLDPNTEYGYRVKARDKSGRQNETEWSAVRYITTLLPADLTAPTPDPMEWDTTEDANGFTGLPHEVNGGGGSFDYWAEMRAVTATDDSGVVEYFFECTSISDLSSGWIAEPTYMVQVGRQGWGYFFRVKARDAFGNETAWSTEERMY